MMKFFRILLLMGCAIVAFAAVAQEYDPVIASIDEARQQAKESIKKNKSMGNEMVTTVNYTVRGQGKTTKTVRFYFNTAQGTYFMPDDSDPHFFYHPLYYVTSSYNIGKKKYNEEYLFDSYSQRLMYLMTQDYDANGKFIERKIYFHEGSVYFVQGPPIDDFMEAVYLMQANELKIAFDNIIGNPKE